MSPIDTQGMGDPVGSVTAVPTGSGSGQLLVAQVSTTVEELPKVGKPVAVILAPATGPTGVAPGTPVGLVTQHFWESPTIIKARRILIGCAVTGAGSAALILSSALSAGKTIWELPWGAAGTVFLTAAFGALLTTFFMRQKSIDNNPVG